MNTLAVIAGKEILHQLLILVVVGVVIGIVLWVISISPMAPPFKKFLTWFCYVVGAVFIINFLFGLIGWGFISF